MEIQKSNQIPNEFISADLNVTLHQRRVFYAIMQQIKKSMVVAKPNENVLFEIPKTIIRGSGYTSKLITDFCEKITEMKIRLPETEYHDGGSIRPIPYAMGRKDGFIEVKVLAEAYPLFEYIGKGYSKFDYEKALSLKSDKSQILFEHFSKKINNLDDDVVIWETDVDELRSILSLEDKLTRWSQFKERAIDAPLKQINENTSLKVEVEFIKKGRSFHYIDFVIRDNSIHNSTYEEVEIAVSNDKDQRCLEALKKMNINDKKIQNKIINDQDMQKAFWRWRNDVKTGKIKVKSSYAGHLLKTLGLVKNK